MKFGRVFVAGTFDGLHAGHRALLARAFSLGEKVIIGLTSDTFVKKFKIHNSKFNIHTYEKRKKVLQDWLGERKGRARIVPIDDPYEPVASIANVDALLVTKQNRARGEEINRLRKRRGLGPLVLVEAPMLVAQDGVALSGSRVRSGEVDHDGRLILPEAMRDQLRQPLGKLLTGQAITRAIAEFGDGPVVTVGDVATKTLLDASVPPVLAVIDGKVGRKPFREVIDRLQTRKTSPFQVNFHAKSGPGFISREAVEAIQKVFTDSAIHPSTHHAIIIKGEEDLLVIPAIIHAPVGSVIYYGQPGEGLVKVVVTREKKREALALLRKFT